MCAVRYTIKGEPRWFLRGLVSVRIRGDETDGHLGMVEMIGPPGDEPPLHVHHTHEECFHVLEGDVTLHFPGGVSNRLGVGDTIVAPRGVPHTYRVGDDGARWLLFCTPSGFEAFVAHLSRPADAPVLPAGGPPAPEEVARLAAAAREYGIEILGPPGARPV